MSNVVHIDIGGKPYTLKRIDGGYAICSAVSPSDRFYRSYMVKADDRGMPQSCTCPYRSIRGLWCKHCKAVEKWWRQNTEQGREAQRQLVEWAAKCGFDDP